MFQLLLSHGICCPKQTNICYANFLFLLMLKVFTLFVYGESFFNIFSQRKIVDAHAAQATRRWENLDKIWHALHRLRYAWNFFRIFFNFTFFSTKYSFFELDLDKQCTYRHFQLATIYYCCITLIWIKFGMRLADTNTQRLFSCFFFFFQFLSIKYSFFEHSELDKQQHFQLGTIYYRSSVSDFDTFCHAP